MFQGMTWITSTRNGSAGRRRSRAAAGVLTSLAIATGMALAATPASAEVIPPADTATQGIGQPSNNWPDAFAKGLVAPDAAPIGTNDWNCKPTAEHPNPVVLVHGTWMNAYNGFSGLAPQLKDEGYCLFALNYGKSDLANKGGLGTAIPGVYATLPIQDSSKQLAAFVDAVLAGTGADKVDIISHSQGGLLARQYLKFDGGHGKVDNLISMGATHNGTSLMGIGALHRTMADAGLDLEPVLDYLVGVSGMQQVYNSDLIKTLNAEGQTLPGVTYTVIGTRHDEITTPYEATFLDTNGPGVVRNITVQDGCGTDFSDHLSMQYSPRVTDYIKNALDPVGFPESQIRCTGHAWLGGESDGGFGGTGSVGNLVGGGSSNGS